MTLTPKTDAMIDQAVIDIEISPTWIRKTLREIANSARMEGIEYFIERMKANGHWEPEWMIDEAAMEDPVWQAEMQIIIAQHPEWR